MGFFGPQGFVTKAIKKIKSQQQDTSNPGHTHGSKDSGGGGGVDPIDNSVASGRGTVKGDVSRVDSAMIAPSFMGKDQVDPFSSLTDPLSVDRSGRTVSRQDDSASLDPVGIEPAMNPSLATPVDVDEQGVNSLY
jgi:hypothetical protein|tara:strand:+ start:512 stop:916 length:405 start_codon:yes stop_codon:yes gene_type:complete